MDRSLTLSKENSRWLTLAFAAATFTSAFLLFQIQPLVSKRILPWFGGSPAVWTACLLFFQVLLLAGYCYAHVIHTRLRTAYQALTHLALLATAIVFLQVLPGDDSIGIEARDPVVGILFILASSVGLPYFALAATGPLLQAWFGRQFPDRSPYRLYALSNLGSLLALVSYPLLVEWLFELPQQAQIWSWGFALLVALFACVAALCARYVAAPATSSPREGGSSARPNWSQYLAWLIWPACGSITLMATTNHVSADVAAVPLLWVVPLALYLVTFIIAFDHPRWHRPTLTAALTLVAVYGTALVNKEDVGWINVYDCGMTGRCVRLFVEAITGVTADATETASSAGPRFRVGFLPYLSFNYAAMFGICLLCHGELVRRRPAVKYLTTFYLAIAAGGAVGGAAVTLLAPRLFTSYFEWTAAMFFASIGALGLILHALVNRSVPADNELHGSSAALSLAPRLILVLLLLPTALVLLDLVEYLHAPKKGVQFQGRNFFGTLTVRERNPENPRTHNRVLLHGVTVHGSQFVAPERRGQPTTYYSTVSGVGRVLNYYRSQPPHGGIRIGDIGLGTGTVAAYAGKGDSICFYEIDPAIVEIATSGLWFSYLADCQDRGAKCDIKLGDGRLTMQEEQKQRNLQRYHVLVLDAFSGDAVPVHLLTAEACDLYLARLATADADGEHGALAVNISNRYLDLARVVRAAAANFNIRALHIHSPQVPDQSFNSADWMILSRNEELLTALLPFAYEPAELEPPATLWSDTRSSLFEVLK